MSKIIWLSLIAFFWVSCDKPVREQQVNSPGNNVTLKFFVNAEGKAGYMLYHKEKPVIDSSFLGFSFVNAEPIDKNLKVAGVKTSTFDETWEMPWGEQRYVKNNYNELLVSLQEQKESGRKFDVIFRVYEDGMGFRYEFPEQDGWQEALIAEENTEFKLTGDYTCWWAPGDWDIYEHLYNTSLFSGIDALSKRNHPNLAQTYIPVNAVNTPLTIKTDDGLYLSFHEADLDDYSDMTLLIDKDHLSMRSNLVGSENTDYKVKRALPFNTPWRTIQVAERAGDLIESKLIVNLNEPNQLGDVSWIKPMKYVGIWWGMHLGTTSWDIASGKHGATTAEAKRYIDFAAANNIGGLLVEGWNTGWERWAGFEDREGVFDFVTSYPDYDLAEVVRYGKEKGVELIMHHETSAAPRTYEQQLDTAYRLMEGLGIHAVKTGYVGKIIPKGEYHHGQWMINHYAKVAKEAAKHRIAVDAHEPVKATGHRRTYPNVISREGLRGQEFNAWASDGGNPPEHLPIVAFTRMLAGPIDYTPGIFDIKLKPYKPDNQVNTTLAQQLALYVVIYSPVQMVADLPEHYEGHPAFQFIRDVAVDWDESKVVDGEVGDFVTIARKERNGDRWFIGAITDENARKQTVKLDFLDKDKQYVATIYEDGADADWDKNPTAYNIRTVEVNCDSAVDLALAAGGGAAIELKVK